MEKKCNQRTKEFTIIELVVVITIIGVLVLLAMPRFIGYVKNARLTHIKNDIKIAESVAMEEFIIDNKFPNEWKS